jgi:hypothetical protein
MGEEKEVYKGGPTRDSMCTYIERAREKESVYTYVYECMYSFVYMCMYV